MEGYPRINPTMLSKGGNHRVVFRTDHIFIYALFNPFPHPKEMETKHDGSLHDLYEALWNQLIISKVVCVTKM